MKNYIYILALLLLSSHMLSGQVLRLTDNAEGSSSTFKEDEINPIKASDDNFAYYVYRVGTRDRLYAANTTTFEVDTIFIDREIISFFTHDGLPHFRSNNNDGNRIMRIDNGKVEEVYSSTFRLTDFTSFNGDLYFAENDFLMKWNGNTVEQVYEFYFFGGIVDIGATEEQLFIIGADEDARRLFTSDGTTAGTEPYMIINEGSEFNREPYMTPVGNKMFFFWKPNDQPYSLYVTDGTEAGTQALIELNSISFDDLRETQSIIAFNDKLYFLGWVPGNPQNNYDVFQSDGTVAGTKFVFDQADRENAKTPEFFHEYNEELYFKVRNDFWGTEWYKITKEDETPIKPLSNYGLNATYLANYGDELIFSGRKANANTSEIYATMGSNFNTRLLTNIKDDNLDVIFPFDITPIGEKIVFVSNSDEYGRELFIYDSTISSTAEAPSFDYTVSPNPAYNQVTLRGLPSGNSRVSIVTVDGRMMKSIEVSDQQTELDVSQLPVGTYVVKVESDQEGISAQILTIRR